MQCLPTRLKHDDHLNPASRSPNIPHLPVPHFADKTETAADMADLLETTDLTLSPLHPLALQPSLSPTEADAESCHKGQRWRGGRQAGLTTSLEEPNSVHHQAILEYARWTSYRETADDRGDTILSSHTVPTSAQHVLLACNRNLRPYAQNRE
jgi:hypothetical protein